MIPLVLAATILGSPYFQALVLIAVAILGWEWLSLLGLNRSPVDLSLFFAGLAAAMFVTVAIGWYEGLWATVTACLALIVVYLARDRGHAAWLGAGAIYVLLPCWSLLWLRSDAENGLLLLLWIFFVVWASDIGAFAVGRTVGGPKLLPSVSPQKTWSGLAGGMISAAVVAVLFVGFLDEWNGNLNHYAATGFFAAIVGAIGQFGDMVESRIKRLFGVKDMGTLIPGHGGLFDRVDGLMFVAPAIALLKVLFPEGFAL